MDSPQRLPAKALFSELQENVRRTSTRKGAYANLTADAPCIPHSLCMTPKRAGVVSPTHSLKFTFSVEEEELLAVVCLHHAHQGTPKTIPDFVSLATKFAEKKKDEKIIYLIVCILFI